MADGTVTSMPELPEVETIRRQLEPRIVGRRLVDGDTHWSAKFVPARDAVGTTVEGLDRRGKYLIFALDDGNELVVHLGMTGSLAVWSEAVAALDDYVRAWWVLADGDVLVFRDVRRFGRIRVVPAGDYSSIATLAALGPEPLSDDFTADGLYEAVRASSRRVKTQLLSQRPVAGVGNIYADEALWQARVHPGARRLTKSQARDLHAAIRATLGSGLAHGGTTLRDYRDADGGSGENQHHLVCYGRADEPCLRCGTALRSRVYDARTTTYCPDCQSR